MPQVHIRKPRVSVRAGLTIDQLYRQVLAALEQWNDEQATAFAGRAIYIHTREQMLRLADAYVDLIELPSA